MKRKKMLVATTAIFSFLMATTSLAGTWQTGKDANQNKWWYENDDGTYVYNRWKWIDGNNDGFAECYSFDEDGWLETNKVTSDNEYVNDNGAWEENGIVQKIEVEKNRNEYAIDSRVGEYHSEEVWNLVGSSLDHGYCGHNGVPEYYIIINNITNKEISGFTSRPNYNPIDCYYTATSQPGVYISDNPSFSTFLILKDDDTIEWQFPTDNYKKVDFYKTHDWNKITYSFKYLGKFL